MRVLRSVNYEPRALAAADRLGKARRDAQLALRRSDRGAFEIRTDGRMAFSKQAVGRLPTDAEIIGLLT
jgi:hypothetical protein